MGSSVPFISEEAVGKALYVITQRKPFPEKDILQHSRLHASCKSLNTDVA